MSDKSTVQCVICGDKFQVSNSTVRRKKYNECTDWKCRSCLAKELKEKYKNLSDEEKQRRASISSERMKEVWKNMNNQEKQRRMHILQNGYNSYIINMTPEEKERNRLGCKERMIKRWLNMNPSDRERIIKIMQDGFSIWHGSLSPDQKKAYHDRLQKANLEWWYSLTNLQKDHYSRIRSEASKKYWNNITIEDKLKISERQHNIIQEFWNSMTEEEYREWDEKRAKGFRKYMEKLIDNVNKNESDLISMLSSYGFDISPHVYNIFEHPEFRKKFPINPITKSHHVSPIHQWDIMVNTLNKIVFIDIDGSIHDENHIKHDITYYDGKKYSLSDLIKFNDSQRPYQTDGNDAYIVQCYDDHLTLETPVLQLGTNKMMIMRDLIMILLFDNLSNEEIHSLIDSNQ